MRTVSIAILVALLAGCTRSETFRVVVVNRTSHDLTAVLTKSGGPVEAGWISPEDAAILSPRRDEMPFESAVIPAGGRGGIGPITGRFDSGSRAVMRLYGGAFELDELLAISRGSPLRVDAWLEPGDNLLTVPPEVPLRVVRSRPTPAQNP